MNEIQHSSIAEPNGLASPQDAQQIIEVDDVASGPRRRGHIKDRGQPLEPTGKVVAGRGRSDGPFAEA